ncbi:MAG: 2OG-Fe(II) oxygenase [Bacteroidia bacterium]
MRSRSRYAMPHTDTDLEPLFEAAATRLAEDAYAVLTDLMPPGDAHRLLDVLRETYPPDTLRQAGIGQQQDFAVRTRVRGDQIRWIDPTDAPPAVQDFYSRIHGLMHYLNRTCYLGLQDFESHFTTYPPGTYYQRHLDQFRHDDHRRLSFIYYLNPHWQPGDGGELLLYLPDGQTVVVEPRLGVLACFRSELLEHEVRETRVERYSLTGWMLNCPAGLGFLG